MKKNEMVLEFDSISENEAFARVVVAAFAAQLDPTLEEIADIKTAVSEAVTNAIIHGYENGEGKIKLHCLIEEDCLKVEITDTGVGIENIEQAKESMYTTRPEWERSGMGFTFMETFMDHLMVESKPSMGTKIYMDKRIQKQAV